jgi:hypothetical protein
MSKVDKILKQFTKAVKQLDQFSINMQIEIDLCTKAAEKLELSAKTARVEQERAQNVAKKIKDLVG